MATGNPIPDLLWHFTTGDKGLANIQCELAIASEYEQFIQHVNEGVESQTDIAEMMNRHKGTVSKWAARAIEENRLVKRRAAPSPTQFILFRPIIAFSRQ